MSWCFKDKLILVDVLGIILMGMYVIYVSEVELIIESESEKDEFEISYSGVSLEMFYGEYISFNFKIFLVMSGVVGNVFVFVFLLFVCGMV